MLKLSPKSSRTRWLQPSMIDTRRSTQDVRSDAGRRLKRQLGEILCAARLTNISAAILALFNALPAIQGIG